MIPKVDTFGADIAEEIKRKDASLAEITAASNDIGNDTPPPKKVPFFFIFLAIFFVLILVGFGVLAYFYFNDPLLSPQTQPVITKQEATPKPGIPVSKLSPSLDAQVGRFVTKVTKQEKGYILTINSYSPVFAYMTRNEMEYIPELLSLFYTPEEIASTQKEVLNEQTPIVPVVPVATTTEVLATTSQATSTNKVIKKSTSKQVATTTATTTEEVKSPVIEKTPVGPYFTDITLSNQNMRIYRDGKMTVIYAFVGDTTVLISDTTDGILALKGAILH